MNLFQTLLHPDHEGDPDRGQIADAANLLQIGEFQILQIAYAEWHGSNLTGPGLDQMFKAYMLEGVVPPWARHFARKVIDQARAGEIDINDPAYHRFDSEYFSAAPLGRRKFAVAVVLIFAAVGGGLLVGGSKKSTTTSVLPPYFEAEHLAPVKTAPTKQDALPGNQGG